MSLGPKIYDSANVSTTATVEGTPGQTSLSSLPLGMVAGEVAAKVMVLGGGGSGAVTITNGGDVAEGTTTDAPIADNTTVASATAATGIGLWKRLVNLGIAILAKQPSLGTAGTASSNVITVQGITSGTTLSVTETAKQYTGTPSSFVFLTADGTVFTLAAGEVGFIQNCDDAALAVKKGASASSTSLSLILKACATADDGSGGYVIIKDWVGVVSVAAMTGSPRYLAWKQAP